MPDDLDTYVTQRSAADPQFAAAIAAVRERENHRERRWWWLRDLRERCYLIWRRDAEVRQMAAAGRARRKELRRDC